MEFSPACGIVTLITDFGLQDPYAGQLKGMLLKGCRAAQIIDITHAVPSWDVLTGAITLHSSYLFFPAGTIHLVVVDPGVGSDRAIVAATGAGHFFIAPDNGLLSFLVEDGLIDEVYQVDTPQAIQSQVSPTFHGRDIMAPAAAALLQGKELQEIGCQTAVEGLIRVQVPPFALVGNTLHAQVQHIDHFGNIRTSVRIDQPYFHASRFACLDIGGKRITRLCRFYSEARPGELLALVDSSGYLEIAVCQGKASAALGSVPGDPITLYFVDP